MRILLVGAGGVGTAFARIAARRRFAELVIADYDLERAQRAAAARDGFEAVQLDARDERAAAELLGCAVARTPADLAQHNTLVRWLAEALYRVGDPAEAERVAQRGLAATSDPDLLVDLHWTLAQCRMLGGSSAASLDTLERALSSPGLTARHRARLR